MQGSPTSHEELDHTAGGEFEPNALESPKTILPPWSLEKLSAIKPVPGVKKVGAAALVEPN